MFGIEEQESLVDPISYRLVRLQIDKSANVDRQEFDRSNNGMVTLLEPKTKVDQLCEVTLLRSVDWIEDHDAEVGGTIFLDMPEMGVEGWAEVLAIEACPELEVGNGQRITGTFKHTSGEVYDLKLESESEPIGVTAQHPFWSVDRGDWVSAVDLEIGETLKTLDGTTVVESFIQRPEPEPVYNIEVENDHVYRVGESGVLLHNASVPAGVDYGCEWVSGDGRLSPCKSGLLSTQLGGCPSKYAAHHIVPCKTRGAAPKALARAVQLGFDINGDWNGICLPRFIPDAKKSGKPLHSGGHIGDYYDCVSGLLRELEREFKQRIVTDCNLCSTLSDVIDAIEDALLSHRIWLQKDDPNRGTWQCPTHP